MSGGERMSGGFYVDADEQRAKARLAEQRLLEHSMNRTPRQRPLIEEDPIESSLPPVFRKEGYYETARDTSVDRRAARFRDGLPPPPPPDTTDMPRVLLPPAPPLMDQQAFDRGVPIPTPRPILELPPPPLADDWLIGSVELPEQVFVSNGAASLPDAQLSPSQKKRLRRKRKKEEQRSQQGSANGERRPAPMPLPIDRQYLAPVPETALPPIVPPKPPVEYVLVPPSPSHPEITQTACNAETMVRMPNGSAHRVRCPLRPFPHPNQPHMIQLADATGQGTEIFLGFWLEGE